MSYTKAELQARFFRNFNEISTDSEISAANAVLIMEEVYDEFVREFKTYLKTAAIPVAAGINEFDIADIEPYLAAGEAIETLQSVLYAKGTSALITAFAASGAKTEVTSVAHGRSDGDEVQIFGTLSYDGKHTVSDKTDDTFEIAVTYVADDACGTWVLQESYRRCHLQHTEYGRMQDTFLNPINPSDSEVPRGTIFLEWVCNPPALPAAGDIPDVIFPSGLQGVIADEASLRGLQILKESDVYLADKVNKVKAQLVDLLPAPPPIYFGSYKANHGSYAYRRKTNSALIINPREW